MAARRGDLVGIAPFQRDLTTSVTRASRASSEATAKARGEVVLVVENLDMQRHGVGLARGCGRRPPTPRRTRPWRARCTRARRRAAPILMLGSVTLTEGLPAVRAKRQRGLLVPSALLLHQRDQLARDEREGDEDGGEHDAGQREDDLDVVRS